MLIRRGGELFIICISYGWKADKRFRYVFTSKTRLPAGKAMEKARLGTFTTNGWWPHDAVKNHGANSKKVRWRGIYSLFHVY
jgi:hypothetical protein